MNANVETEDKDPAVVNGKRYSLWPQFVTGKAEYIGGALESTEDGSTYSTVIKDITFEPNGTDSAMFSVAGEEFGCASDVHYLAFDPRTCGEGWIGFIGYGGHSWRIKKKGGAA